LFTSAAAPAISAAALTLAPPLPDSVGDPVPAGVDGAVGVRAWEK
jgi:hypothetical protein